MPYQGLDAFSYATSGPRQADIDVQNKAKTLMDLALGGSEVRLKSAQAGLAELELEGEKRMTSMLSGLSQNGTAGPGSATGGGQMDPWGIAGMYARSGLFKQAREWGNFASLNDARRAQMDANRSRQDWYAMKQNQQRIQDAGALVGSIDSQASLDAIKPQLIELMTDPNDRPEVRQREIQEIQALQYTPEGKQQLQRRFMTMGQQLTEDFRRRTAAATERFRDQTLKSRNFANNLAARRTNAYVSRITNLNKGGGRGAGSPSQNELTMAMDQLPKGMSGLDQTLAATELASRAKALSKQGNMNYNEAMQRVLTDMHREGTFKDVQGRTRYSGQGKTAETAIPVPAKKEDREVGKYYLSPSTHQVAKWTGTGWAPVEEDNDGEPPYPGGDPMLDPELYGVGGE